MSRSGSLIAEAEVDLDPVAGLPPEERRLAPGNFLLPQLAETGPSVPHVSLLVESKPETNAREVSAEMPMIIPYSACLSLYYLHAHEAKMARQVLM